MKTKFRRPSRQESLRKILAYADQPKRFFVDAKYSNGKGCKCAVGVLFSPAQLRDISKRGLQGVSVKMLAHQIGVENIEFVTGLTLPELEFLQDANDDNLELREQGMVISRKDAVRAVCHHLMAQ